MTGIAEARHEFALSEADFRAIAAKARAETGIVLGEHKRNLVYGRLARRLRALGLSGFDAYVAHLEGPGGAEELREMLNALTTNLTSFFREPHHFETLEREVLPGLVARAGETGARVRLWSAGCSSGEEPYSLALLLAAALPRGRTIDAKILATDIDTNMVATAQRGLYEAERIAAVPARLARSGFVPRDDGRVAVADGVRALVTFKALNLFHAWPMRGPFDVIFCRNVMIYFDKPSQGELLQRFAQMLAPGGVLCIGHSETVPPALTALRHVGRTTYRRVAA